MSGSDNIVPAGPEEKVAEEAFMSRAFRTQLMSVLAAPWGCGACKAQGMIFDPRQLKELQERRTAQMQCPNCKAVVHLMIPLIQEANASPQIPGLPGYKGVLSHGNAR